MVTSPALARAVLLVAAALLLTAPHDAAADAVKCRAAIAKAGAQHALTRRTRLSRCTDRVLRGLSPPGTDCAGDARTAPGLARAEAKLRQTIASACGGGDRSCGSGGDDEPLVGVGWSTPSCPDVESAGCTQTIRHCGDVADCALCLNAHASDTVLATSAARADLASPPGSDLERCQGELARASAKLFAARSRALQKCWDAVSRGKATGPCPVPGDGKAAATIAKAEQQAVAAICKRCGGADAACDDAVGALPGSGGDDDLLPRDVGFVANCADLSPPDAASGCARPIRDLADVASCLTCVSAFHGQCVDRAAVPWATAYPESCSTLVLAEDFTGSDGAAWPAPWTPLGGVALADLQGGRARFRPVVSGYSLARMGAAVDTGDVDVRLVAELGDESTQGLGFYVRQNGGWLQQTPTHGAGYAVFVEKFRPDGAEQPGIGLWIEQDGVEIPLQIDFGEVPMVAAARYAVRLRVHDGATSGGVPATRLQAKMWPEGAAEPAAWTVEHVDTNPLLQGVTGGVAADAWSDLTDPFATPTDLFLDDVLVRRTRSPLAAIGAVVAVSEAFQFTEGPRWLADDGVLLFTDIAADTIYRLTPPSAIDVFRTPSNAANGLAVDVNGDLLAAEHATRRVSRTDSGGVVTTLVDSYLGDALNSPNDVAVRSDGTVYFTDPRYGNPPVPELAFNGLFRRTPGGALTPEWQGTPTDGPNGVDLSPDESVLYMSNTATGEVLAWDVQADGSLANQRVFASGLTIPDGMCVDAAGNVFVATWANALEVFDPEGTRWGSIALPRAATNCGFGGADLRTLYMTAHEGLYRVAVTIPGIP